MTCRNSRRTGSPTSWLAAAVSPIGRCRAFRCRRRARSTVNNLAPPGAGCVPDGPRDPDAAKPADALAGPADKEEKDKYSDAAKGAAENVLDTPIGKELVDVITNLPGVRQFEKAALTPGGIVGLVGGAGTIIGTLGVGGADMPTVPKIPLDFLLPGLSAKLTWKGLVREPTEVGITITLGPPTAKPGAAPPPPPAQPDPGPMGMGPEARGPSGCRHALGRQEHRGGPGPSRGRDPEARRPRHVRQAGLRRGTERHRVVVAPTTDRADPTVDPTADAGSTATDLGCAPRAARHRPRRLPRPANAVDTGSTDIDAALRGGGRAMEPTTAAVHGVAVRGRLLGRPHPRRHPRRGNGP